MDFSWNRVGLILVAAAALLALWVWSKRSSEVVEQAKPSAGQVVEQAKTPAGEVAGSLSVDGVDLKSSVQTALNGLKTTLQGVTDAVSAKAALVAAPRTFSRRAQSRVRLASPCNIPRSASLDGASQARATLRPRT